MNVIAHALTEMRKLAMFAYAIDCWDAGMGCPMRGSGWPSRVSIAATMPSKKASSSGSSRPYRGVEDAAVELVACGSAFTFGAVVKDADAEGQLPVGSAFVDGTAGVRTAGAVAGGGSVVGAGCAAGGVPDGLGTAVARGLGGAGLAGAAAGGGALGVDGAGARAGALSALCC